MIKKRTRKELYDKFRQGAIPTGADFADFIRSQLNLLEDGIDVPEDTEDPIILKSHGEKESYLDLSDKDGRKQWRISGINEAEDETEIQEGLNFTAEGLTRLFIDRITGNTGIGNDKPDAKLHIKQTDFTDALRIDDEPADTTPFIVTGEGNVGIGKENPTAKLHVNSPGTGDAFRVDDAEQDTTPFVVTSEGRVGIRVLKPEAVLDIAGNVFINEEVTIGGNLNIGGNILIKGLNGEEELLKLDTSASISVENKDLYINDNVYIKASTEEGYNANGDLHVEGNTNLGDPVKDTTVVVNGKIRSGEYSNEPYKLDVNETLIVDRESGNSNVTVNGNLDALGTSKLGNNQGNDYIYLNGTVQREGSDAITIDDDVVIGASGNNRNLTVNGNTVLGNSSTDNITHKGTITSKEDVLIEKDLNVTGTIEINTNLKVAGVNYAYVPRGVIVMWSGNINTLPSGWALCNGQNNTPDLRDRFIVSAGNNYNVKDTGGQDSVQLTWNQMPSHNHSGSTNYEPDHSHLIDDFHYLDTSKSSRYGTDAGDDIGIRTTTRHYTLPEGRHAHSFTTSFSGRSQSHENRPTYYALAFIMKL